VGSPPLRAVGRLRNSSTKTGHCSRQLATLRLAEWSTGHYCFTERLMTSKSNWIDKYSDRQEMN